MSKEMSVLVEEIRSAHKRGDTAEAERLERELLALDLKHQDGLFRAAPQSITKPGSGISMILGAAVIAVYLWGLHACATRTRVEHAPPELISNCQNALRAKASHPSTVEFPITGLATDVNPESNSYRVWQSFSAKNSFGLEVRFDGLCQFPPNRSHGDPEIYVREAVD